MSLVSRVTKCCNSHVERRSGKQYPDGITYYISTSWDACGRCGDSWPDTLQSCDCCGEASELLITTKLGEYCPKCTHENADELIERV